MKKWTTIALAVFLCLTPITAFAADAPAGETQQDQEITAGSVYDFLVEQAMKSDGIQSDALYDVGVNMDSFQMLNLQYEVLQTTLESKGFGKEDVYKRQCTHDRHQDCKQSGVYHAGAICAAACRRAG